MAIKDFNDSMLIAISNMDYSTIEPMNNFMFHPLFDKQWIDKIEKAMEKIKENNISLREVATAIKGGSNLRVQIFFLLLDLKSANISKERRIKIANFFHDVLRIKSPQDTYGYKSNILHTHHDIDHILKKDFSKADPDIAKQLGIVYTGAYHLVNGLYTDFYTDFGTENIGPYHIKDNKILIIKHFEDLRPLAFWPALKTPCKTITIYTIYENVRFKCDAVSCHSIYEGDTINGLSEYRIEVDGRPIKPEELQPLANQLNILAAEQWQNLINLNKEDLKIKGLFMRNYVLKSFFDLVGIDWKPDQDMLKAVENKEFAKGVFKPPENNPKEYWKKVLDPEEDTIQ